MKTFWRRTRKLLIIIRLIISTSPALLGQELVQEEQPAIQVRGTIALSTEAYSADGIGNRRTGNESFATMLTTVSMLEGYLRIPLELYTSTREDIYNQSTTQFGIHPEYKDWLKLHGGHYRANLSDFTLGSSRLFGGGIELRPGSFRTSAFIGTLRSAVGSDSSAYIPGQYRRNAFGTNWANANAAKSQPPPSMKSNW